MSDDDDDDNGGDKPRRPHIRPVSRSNAGPFSKLKATKCFAEVDRRIRLGWSTADIAVMIRDEYNECTDISINYLKKMVDQYRSSIPPAELALNSANSMVSRNATKRLAEGLDELAEIERLYRLQMERIDIDLGNEKKINKLMANTGREVFVALKILKQSTELKMDLGLVKRQLGSVEVNGSLAADIGERYGKDSLGKVIADPESRRRVLGLAERLLSLGARAGLDAVEMLGNEPEQSVIDVTPTSSVDSEES